jgi:V/A-type H+-transporting ATPase subunit I
MFFPERIKRIRFLVLENSTGRVVKRLHELGAVQISDCRERLADPLWAEALSAHPAHPDQKKIALLIAELNRLSDVFSSLQQAKKKGLFGSLLSPPPPAIIQPRELLRPELFSEAETTIAAIDAELSGLIERLEHIEIEELDLIALRDSFSPVAHLEIPLELVGKGPGAAIFLGIAPGNTFQELLSEVKQATDGAEVLMHETVSGEKKALVCACLAVRADEVHSILRKWGVELISPAGYHGSPKQAIGTIEARINNLREEQKILQQSINEINQRWSRQLALLREELLIERARAEIQTCFGRTEYVAAIEGWVPSSRAETVSNAINNVSTEPIAIELAEPDEPATAIPVALNNPGILKHFEFLTKLYAHPRYDEIDPTVLICPSFLFFFAIMVTDAMYGFMTLALGLLLLFKGGGRYDPVIKAAGVILSLGGAATVILGAITGGWFGNLATKYLGIQFLNRIILFDPLAHVSAFLIFSLGVGLAQLNLGICMGIVQNLRRGHREDAVRNIWMVFLELFLIFYYLDLAVPAYVCAVPAALLLLYSAKGMFLFSFTGFIGDVLSYARLVALGLVSFGFAIAINALIALVWNIQYIGWLLALILLIAGHLFGWVLNVIGAFAHSIRLHFVEFFGKFYTGGGQEFVPFGAKKEFKAFS